MDSDGVLYGLNPTSGAVQEHATVGAPANHFPTPSVGDGLLLAAAASRVVAYTAAPTAGPTTTTTTGVAPTTGRAPTTTGTTPASPGSSNAWVIAVAVAGGLVVLGGVFWLVRRRRPTRDVP